jgi:hypothetical protein
MAYRLTNNMLSQLLLTLGFERGRVTELNQRIWRHPASGCTLQLPANKVAEAPRSADLVGIKAQLDLHGHLDEEAFDDFAADGRLPARASGEN